MISILICSPYNEDVNKCSGGIDIWMHNIVDYHKSIKSDVALKIIPYNRSIDIKVEDGFLKRLIFGIKDFRIAIWQTFKALKSKECEVLHLCTSASFSLFKDAIVLGLAKFFKVKTIIHFHFGRIPEIKERQNWEWLLLKCITHLSDRIITIDKESYRALSTMDSLHFVPNPLSLSVTKIIDKYAPTTNRKQNRILFVGHVIPTKGVYDLMSACKDIEGIEIIIVGKVNSDIITKMKEIVGEKFLNTSKLVFKGEIHHDCVIQEMLEARVFVLPSYTEGFPNVILESMASGCPIVSTNVGAIPEMLSVNSVNPCGICVNPGDIGALNNSIRRMLSENGFSIACSENAKKRVKDQYFISVVWNMLVNIWEK